MRGVGVTKQASALPGFFRTPWELHSRMRFPYTSLILITLVSIAVQSLVFEPALSLHVQINLWPYVLVGLAFIVLPFINGVATQMALFFSISVKVRH